MSVTKSVTCVAAAAVLAMVSVGVAALAQASEAPAATSQAPGSKAKKCHGHRVTIRGTNDDDRIGGTPRRDVISAGRGDDVIRGRGGNDVICGSVGSDELYGGNGKDILDGGTFKSYSVGGGEAQAAKGDAFVGGHGDDRIIGGGDRKQERSIYDDGALYVPDRVSFPEARARITLTKNGFVKAKGIGRDRLVDIQKITGTKWRDKITIRGDHRVSGAGGDDRITVLAGRADWPIRARAHGGVGDDRVDVSRYRRRDHIVEGGPGRDRLIGSPQSDDIYGGSGAGVIRGRGGNDEIFAKSRVSVHGDAGRDLLVIEASPVGRVGSIDGGAGRDRLSISTRRRAPIEVDLPDRRLGVRGHDGVLRRAERFRVGAWGADATFIGTGRADRLAADADRGRVVRAKLGRGYDTIRAGTPNYRKGGQVIADGGKGNDTFSSNRYLEGVRFLGRGGNDTLNGGKHADTLLGGRGNDTADGKDGNDKCRAEHKTRCER